MQTYKSSLDVEPKESKKRLGEWAATAICGNDITSSCLYVSALSLAWAGPKAPICLLMVAGVLWLFRGIYHEVVGALPLNGGAYNALLNTTLKRNASIAACLTILSYLATAVISAHEATGYGHFVLHRVFHLTLDHAEQIGITIFLLLVFALLVIRGIKESSHVALGIFIFHISSLTLLLLTGAWWIYQNGPTLFFENLASSPPEPSDFPIFLGFAVAMLGISGFESSANFVEEQKEGVFPKTLRNMWLAVSVFNPLMCVLALALVPLASIPTYEKELLAHMASVSAGSWFGVLFSINAAMVLMGAVLTSYVGVTGLVHRMTIDRCLPQLLLKTSKYGTHYRIILLFFILASLLLVVAGEVHVLAGVYTISFLSVMALFVVGNVLLKVKRSRLPREKQVTWITLVLAMIAVLCGIVGNVYKDIEYVQIFALYFIPTLLIVMIMLYRIPILRIGIYSLRAINEYIRSVSRKLTQRMEDKIEEINSQVVVFFTRGDNIANLNDAMLYVRDNEPTDRIKVVTVVEDEKKVPPNLHNDIKFLDQAYPEIDIELIIEEGSFGPTYLMDFSRRHNIPLNFIFIGSPGDRFPHSLSDLGGVRVII
ncbi:MAG: APC family permease [Bdellovibrionales bacterium]|nr:APC family permease [Bdellovibrionales bacterium]